ncbi:cobalt-precorrin 5A hydrolase [Pelosinus sp. sgz500959]|uniref:cobalt-precorrin 5A hydrolase n=1 Tax=Pelosinus sp. sgz500959 TaxID=3242472 RepID=UPI00366DD47A
MKLAVISVTNQGAKLANQLADQLRLVGHQIELFAKEGRNPLGHASYDSLSTLISKSFSRYEGFIFIMATGIVVRVIAPYIQDKRIDPAVVVMDEQGQYAISLLAGHIGGANELCEMIGHRIGAIPVITTATDVGKKPAADVLAVKLNRDIQPFSALKQINGAIVHGDQVRFFIDKRIPNQEFYTQTAEKLGIRLDTIEDVTTARYDAAVLVTDETLAVNKPHLYLRSIPLAVGIGCRRDTPVADILAAVTAACQSIGSTTSHIAMIGSTVVKQDEVGLLALIEQLAVPSHFFSNEELQQCIDEYQLDVSSFVQKQIGVGNVCAAAAILMGQTNKLLLPKTKYKNVTVAIAPVKSQSLESDQAV